MPFTCTECKQKKPVKERVFQDKDQCKDCVDAEIQRSKQDLIPGTLLHTRPPKFLLDPKDYKRFGY